MIIKVSMTKASFLNRAARDTLKAADKQLRM